MILGRSQVRHNRWVRTDVGAVYNNEDMALCKWALRSLAPALSVGIVLQLQCVAECIALPREQTHGAHQDAEPASPPPSLASCHRDTAEHHQPAAPDSLPDEPCGGHSGWTASSATKISKLDKLELGCGAITSVSVAGASMAALVHTTLADTDESNRTFHPLRTTVLLI